MDLEDTASKFGVEAKQRIHLSDLREQMKALLCNGSTVDFPTHLARPCVVGNHQNGADWCREDAATPWAAKNLPCLPITRSRSGLWKPDWNVHANEDAGVHSFAYLVKRRGNPRVNAFAVFLNANPAGSATIDPYETCGHRPLLGSGWLNDRA